MISRRGPSAARLMQESEFRIQELRCRNTLACNRIVDELFDKPGTYLRWESEHFRLMRAVAEDTRAENERLRLRMASFRLIHSKALFTYLRDQRVTGADRVNVFRAYYGALDYSNAVVAEHGRFLRATWSLLCTDHIETNVLPDEAFINELPEYEALYADYVALYCGRVIAEDRQTDFESAPLIEYMKNAAMEKRRAMMAQTPRQPAERRARGANRRWTDTLAGPGRRLAPAGSLKPFAAFS